MGGGESARARAPRSWHYSSLLLPSSRRMAKHDARSGQSHGPRACAHVRICALSSPMINTLPGCQKNLQRRVPSSRNPTPRVWKLMGPARSRRPSFPGTHRARGQCWPHTCPTSLGPGPRSCSTRSSQSTAEPLSRQVLARAGAGQGHVRSLQLFVERRRDGRDRLPPVVLQLRHQPGLSSPCLE